VLRLQIGLFPQANAMFPGARTTQFDSHLNEAGIDVARFADFGFIFCVIEENEVKIPVSDMALPVGLVWMLLR
jgi:hypothetical protein